MHDPIFFLTGCFLEERIETQNLGKDQTLPALPAVAALTFLHISTFLDAIEIFFVNSHQNGATSWIPRDLPKNVKILITFTTGLYLKHRSFTENSKTENIRSQSLLNYVIHDNSMRLHRYVTRSNNGSSFFTILVNLRLNCILDIKMSFTHR